jgi:hypothetical protein
MVSKKGKRDGWKRLIQDIKEAKKDPQFRKEVRQFVKITSR